MSLKFINMRLFAALLTACVFAGCSSDVVITLPPVILTEQSAQPTITLPSGVPVATTTPVQVESVNASATALPVQETAATLENTAQPTETAVLETPPPPTATAFPVAGIEVHDLKGIEQAAGAGGYWIRRNALPWSAIEPVEGERNWNAVATIEAEMQAIAERGMQTILIVQYAPEWAQSVPGYACGPIWAEKLEAFGSFMYDVVARYSAPPYNVKFFEMGNEPDVPLGVVAGDSQYGCWYDPTAPAYHADDYANMLKAVYPQVKAANPDAQVLIGGLLMDCDPLNPPQLQNGSSKDCTISRFLEFILQNGGAEYFDGVSFHAYDYYSYLGLLGQYSNFNWHSSWDTTGPVLVAKSRYLRALLDVYNRPDAYLINTETALLCGSTGSEPICLTDDFAQTKASYIAQSNTVAQAEHLLGNIWYSIIGWRGSGLVDGVGQPLPVYQALRFNVQMLNGMGYLGKITDFDGVAAYEFQQAGRRLWVAWSLDGNGHDINLPAVPVAAYDMLGTPQTPAQTWNVTIFPVYLEWQE